ncbi:unnamed protein product [Larinioides sclopetarius]|uniref:Uncharacterized protein n=1 Tax=Larinioides sclopetarius TaxID=280406 RepID=A0AAV2BBA6_9ARAC
MTHKRFFEHHPLKVIDQKFNKMSQFLNKINFLKNQSEL